MGRGGDGDVGDRNGGAGGDGDVGDRNGWAGEVMEM